jgi:proline iminopeptidase
VAKREPGERYPAIEPYEHGMLDVGDGNRIYWEVCGNPAGKPALVVHGGPGAGCSVGMRRSFDPDAYRVVLFDQRQCGRSTPHASQPTTDLASNTTRHLIDDMERLREHLGIDRWLLFGGSWGATLAQAYAHRHPDRVSEMVLIAVTTSGRAELDWFTRGIGRFFPAEWERFRDGVPAADRDGSLAAAYRRLHEHPDAAVRERASLDWCAWEDALMTLDIAAGAARLADADPAYRFAFTRIVTHYFGNGAFLEPDQLLRDAGRLSGIPAVLIHGRLDLQGPLVTPWQLVKAWPGSELVVVDEGGHGSGMMEHLLVALDRFAGVAHAV